MIRRENREPGFPDIREANLSDLDNIVAIERAASTSPWPRHIFRDELTRGWSRLLLLTPLNQERPVAFLNYWLDRDEVPVLNIATHPHHRRKGFARLLLHTMLDSVRHDGGRLVTLEVRRSNMGALALYKGLGFRSIGVRPGYYAASSEDALVLVLRLPDPERKES